MDGEAADYYVKRGAKPFWVVQPVYLVKGPPASPLMVLISRQTQARDSYNIEVIHLVLTTSLSLSIVVLGEVLRTSAAFNNDCAFWVEFADSKIGRQ